MGWDFSTEPEFAEKLEWIRTFVTNEIEPLDLAFTSHPAHYRSRPMFQQVVRPLQQQVKAQDLWACHLGPELGGRGFGQVKLALMNEILGRSSWAPVIFGSQAPDSGNAEIIAHYGTPEQKDKYLQPLLDGEIFSCFSMTEPQGGADPNVFTCRAERDGDEWVINGEKWFSSNLRYSSLAIVMAVTDTTVSIYQGASMFLVPTDTPGINIIRNVAVGTHPEEGTHAYVRYENVRVPAENLLGGAGQGFVLAQTRLGGGRIHHAMRTVGICQRALDMMCERALSRFTQGSVLASKQMVQEYVADSWVELHQFRLMVLHAAWSIDHLGGPAARKYIAACKVALPKVLKEIVYRSMHVHGSLGVSTEMPLIGMWTAAPLNGIADGPTEVHKITIARQVLKQYRPSEGLWPSEHLPERIAAAKARFAHVVDQEIASGAM
jgi:acyl-CoA dehydrogenase